MRRKALIPLMSVVVAIGLLAALAGSVMAARVKTYELQRSVNLDDNAIKQMLSAGWMLGGVYPDCGTGEIAGELSLAPGIIKTLLPLYLKLAERNKQEIFEKLKKTNKPARAEEILGDIVAGREKLTKYGDAPEYEQLQSQFEHLQTVIKEIQDTPATKGVPTLDDLIAKLEKFVKDGSVQDVTGAKKALMGLQHILMKQPELLTSTDASNADNVDKLDRLRKAVSESLAKIDKLGGAGCRMTYVFYKEKK